LIIGVSNDKQIAGVADTDRLAQYVDRVAFNNSRPPMTDRCWYFTTSRTVGPPRPAGTFKVFISHGKNMAIVEQVKDILGLYDIDYEVTVEEETTAIPVPQKVGLLSKWNGKPSKKGTGFEQPLAAHQHWHIDVSYINISGTFYYLCSVLDGCSRYIVNWDLRESMTEADIEIILQAAKEKYPEARPRIISDNGPQFIAKDFKEFIRISGMTHVRTSPYYPQSNGKIERWHKSLKGECIRPGTPLSLDDARRLVEGYVEHYNNVRLNSAVGYITPKDMIAGRQQEIHTKRDRKLEAARKQRQIRRQQAA